MKPKVKRVLSIAGSDCSGGAGIQADLKTFTVFGLYGAAVITAVTVQDTRGVSSVEPLSPALVRAQIDAVLEDIGADAVKTGMLATRPIVVEVARALREHGVERLVVDPVLRAQSGTPLLDSSGLEAVQRELFPLASLVTPNTQEASALTGLCVATPGDLRTAAKRLVERGARAVLVKGGHLGGGEAIDVFYDGHVFHELRAPRLSPDSAHGTGCLLSAAIAAGLATGKPLLDALVEAKRFITAAIEHAAPVGHGNPPANPLAWLGR